MQYITDKIVNSAKDVYYWWNEPVSLKPICNGTYIHKSEAKKIKGLYLQVILTARKYFFIRRPDQCMIISIPNAIDFKYIDENVIQITLYPNKNYTIEIFENENNEYRCRFLTELPKNCIQISSLNDHPNYLENKGWVLT
jgi:hypothetical protein